MFAPLRNLWYDESGQDLAEYAILLALIAIIVIAALKVLEPAISTTFNNTASALKSP
jgi:Flp pilus assembly pilin Flp